MSTATPEPALASSPAPTGLSACVIDVATGEVLTAVDDDAVRPIASVGKVLLLIELARRIVHQEIDPVTLLTRTPDDTVQDSGLWQHLHVRSLAVADLAVLVGAVSDNLATNVLLREVGLPAVTATAQALGLRDTRLLDRVRDLRGPQDPSTLSTGTARELAVLMADLDRGRAVDPTVSAEVLGWLNLDTDTSMTAAAFGLDPRAHNGFDRDRWLAHKTGTDTGVRVDVGVLRGPIRSAGYAVLAEFDDSLRDEALTGMRSWGELIIGFTG